MDDFDSSDSDDSEAEEIKRLDELEKAERKAKRDAEKVQKKKRLQKCNTQDAIRKIEEEEKPKKSACPCFGKKKEQDMSKSEQLQLLLERLEKLERKYGHPPKQFGIKYETEILDQRGFIHKICSDRKDLSFLGITSLMKYRVSFFGIYSLTENVDLTYNKVEYMKK